MGSGDGDRLEAEGDAEDLADVVAALGDRRRWAEFEGDGTGVEPALEEFLIDLRGSGQAEGDGVGAHALGRGGVDAAEACLAAVVQDVEVAGEPDGVLDEDELGMCDIGEVRVGGAFVRWRDVDRGEAGVGVGVERPDDVRIGVERDDRGVGGEHSDGAFRGLRPLDNRGLRRLGADRDGVVDEHGQFGFRLHGGPVEVGEREAELVASPTPSGCTGDGEHAAGPGVDVGGVLGRADAGAGDAQPDHHLLGSVGGGLDSVEGGDAVGGEVVDHEAGGVGAVADGFGEVRRGGDGEAGVLGDFVVGEAAGDEGVGEDLAVAGVPCDGFVGLMGEGALDEFAPGGVGERVGAHEAVGGDLGEGLVDVDGVEGEDDVVGEGGEDAGDVVGGGEGGEGGAEEKEDGGEGEGRAVGAAEGGLC